MEFFKKHHRFHEAGQAANSGNVERFGQPAYSLFTSSKVFSLHRRTDILDDADRIVYQARTKFPSLHDKTDVFDAESKPVAHIERKLFTLHQRHYVDMADGTHFELSNELWHLIRDITNIEGLGWKLEGNIAALNFELYDQNGGVVAVIGQKLFSVHDKYSIDIYQPDKERIAIAILVTLQHMIRDREASSSGSSASAPSSGS